MKKKIYNNTEYVLIQYEDNQLLTNDNDTLTYISQTLYGDVTIQIATISKTDDDYFLQVVRDIKDNHISDQNLTALHPSYVEGITDGFYTKYLSETFTEDIFHKDENDFVSYCLQMKPPKERICFYIEDTSSKNGYNENIKICYEILNIRNRKFIELGSFAPYEKGIKFFPFTKMATLFQDKFCI